MTTILTPEDTPELPPMALTETEQASAEQGKAKSRTGSGQRRLI